MKGSGCGVKGLGIRDTRSGLGQGVDGSELSNKATCPPPPRRSTRRLPLPRFQSFSLGFGVRRVPSFQRPFLKLQTPNANLSPPITKHQAPLALDFHRETFIPKSSKLRTGSPFGALMLCSKPTSSPPVLQIPFLNYEISNG